MNATPLAFDAADDEALCALIAAARTRLAVIAPAVTAAVAQALVARLADLDTLALSVVLDADAEVYRLGYGDADALDLLRKAMVDHGDVLRMQPGVRIGVVAADDELLIFAPTPRLIEAGSAAAHKPNAIRLGGGSAAAALAASVGEAVGTKALTPVEVAGVQADLARNPPKPFDISRAVRVFQSQARFVELELRNISFAARTVSLPDDLLGLVDDDLRTRIGTRLKPFDEQLTRVRMNWKTGDKEDERTVDASALNKARARIEKDFTFVVPRFGRVILRSDEAAFEAAVEDLFENAKRYQAALLEALKAKREDFCSRLEKEFGPRWKQQPPRSATRFDSSPDAVAKALRRCVEKVADDALSLAEPAKHLLYKEIAFENISDKAFVETITNRLKQAGAPDEVIASLFKQFDAASAGDQGAKP